MRKYKLGWGLLLLLASLLTACAAPAVPTASDPQAAARTKQQIESAQVITIKEQPLSLSKDYHVFVDGKEVATVRGKWPALLGDTFTLADTSGNVLMQEEQVKRWGVRLTRLAIIRDPEGKTIGYIGEEVLSNLFSIGHLFHFYDTDKQEIGISDQVNFSLLKKNVFYDNGQKVIYRVDKQLALTDVYEIQVEDKTRISPEEAILMVAIEDAIKDGESKKK